MAGVLLGEWGFLDNLNDTSGNGHTATATNYTPSYVTGPTTGTRAIQFTGPTQTVSYGRTGLEPADGTGGVTTMAWVRMDLTSNANAYYGVVHHSRDGAGSTRAGIQMYQERFRPFGRWREQLVFADGIGSNIRTVTPGWHHWCVVDGEDRYEWYIDGVSVQTAARTNHSAAVTWEAFNWLSGHQGTSDAQSVNGLMVSGVRIFSGQLTTAEVNTWMNTAIVGTVSPAQGSGTGAITVVGAGTGLEAPQGAASGSLGLAGLASGQRDPVGAATASTLLVAGSATGLLEATGTGTGTLLFAGDATGLLPAQGSAQGAVLITGTTSGQLTGAGVGVGVVAVAGSASGGVTRGGTALGYLTIHAAASGRSQATRDITITASGPFTRTAASSPGVRATATAPVSRWAATAPER